MKEHKKENQVIQYQDVLMNGTTGRVDGLGRAPKGVNDGNGFVFISHIGDVYPSGLLPIKTGNIRTTSLAEIYRNSLFFKTFVILTSIRESVVFVSFDMFVGISF